MAARSSRSCSRDQVSGALDLAETLREKVARTAFAFQGEAIKVTISVGAAALSGGESSGLDLDRGGRREALRRAKGGGRNRVVA